MQKIKSILMFCFVLILILNFNKIAYSQATPPGTLKTDPSGTAQSKPPGTLKTEPPGTLKTDPPGTLKTDPPGSMKQGTPSPSIPILRNPLAGLGIGGVGDLVDAVVRFVVVVGSPLCAQRSCGLQIF